MTPSRIKLVYVGLLIFFLGLPILGFIALMAVSAYIDATTPDSRVQVINNATAAVERGSVEVSGKRFDVGRLSVGESVSFSFRPGDSAYRVVAVLANGRTIESEVGYVTHGMAYDDRVFIDEKGVKLKSRIIGRYDDDAKPDETGKHAPATRPGG